MSSCAESIRRRPAASSERLRAAGAIAPLLVALACSGARPGDAPASGAMRPSPGAASPSRHLVVISFDGFRSDYPELHGAPTLVALGEQGVRARALVPSFPSKTYPNHYTLATGLRPERHGIVANTMRDPLWNARFSLADRSAVEDGRWWEGEPIWVTAERAGFATAASYWPGTEAAIGGVRPGIWERYDDRIPDATRVEQILDWLDLPIEQRPRLLMLYFAEPDLSGHRYGPEAAETRAAVAHVDALLARLRAGVAARGLAATTDWIVVSDHGMATAEPERAIVLDDFVALEPDEIDDVNIVALLRPRPGREQQVLERLSGAHPHLHVARREEMPERFHFRAHRRIPPLVAWVDPGWTLFATRAARERARASGARGAHGYDPATPEMHGLFVAAGPSFRRGVALAALDNVDLYELMCALLGLRPAPNDGRAESTRLLLAGDSRPEGNEAARRPPGTRP